MKKWLQDNGILEKDKNGEKKDSTPASKSSGNSEPTQNAGESSFNFDFLNDGKSKSSEPEKSSSAPAQASSSSSGSAVDPRIAERLKKIVSEANMPGPDYFEFKQQLEVLKDVIADDATRFKAAFKSLLTQDVTKEKVTESAQKYIQILGNQKTEFEAAVSQKNGKEIDFKTQEASVLNTENENLEKQIADIKAKKEANIQRIKTLGEEVQKAKNEIEEGKKKFEATLNTFVNGIKSDIEKFNSYIK